MYQTTDDLFVSCLTGKRAMVRHYTRSFKSAKSVGQNITDWQSVYQKGRKNNGAKKEVWESWLKR